MDDICSTCEPRMAEFATVSSCEECTSLEKKLLRTAKEIVRADKVKNLSCSICPPNRGENRKRKATHGPKKPKGKNKR